jgi:hypothetical protein
MMDIYMDAGKFSIEGTNPDRVADIILEFTRFDYFLRGFFILLGFTYPLSDPKDLLRHWKEAL